MKKNELKKILKPLIKECIKEVIFEEGVLSGIITEVAQGLQGSSLVQESKHQPRQPQQNTRASSQVTEIKKQVLSAIGNNGYDDIKSKFSNPELFEGTSPIPSADGRGAMSGQAPGDPGVNINNLPGMRNWGSVVSKLK